MPVTGESAKWFRLPIWGLLLVAAGALLSGCASPAALEAQATEVQAEGASCTSAEIENYRELFDSVADEALNDARLLHRTIDGEQAFAEVSAAARRAREREIALRRVNIPECLAFTHLKAIQSAQEMTEATQRLLEGDPESAENLVRSSTDHLVKARRLLELEVGQ